VEDNEKLLPEEIDEETALQAADDADDNLDATGENIPNAGETEPPVTAEPGTDTTEQSAQGEDDSK
jgi:hypothetical protein